MSIICAFRDDIETNFTGTAGGLSPYLVRLIAVSFALKKPNFVDDRLSIDRCDRIPSSLWN